MSGDNGDLRQDERALRIMEAIGAADEDLLERCGVPEAAPENGKKSDSAKVIKMSSYKMRQKPLWRQGRIWAACIGLAAAGVLSWNGLRLLRSADGNDNAGSGYAADAAQSADSAVSLENAPEEESASAVITSGEKSAAGDMEEGAAVESSMDAGDTGTASAQEADSTADSLNDFTGDGRLEPENDLAGDSEENLAGNPEKEVTEEEARSLMPLGAYFPEKLPAGYVAEAASVNESDQTVRIRWARGRDEITISISKVEPRTVETVDVNRPETYDERLYEIPYSETVPAEYLNTLDHPVFAIEDLNADTGPEIMRSRMLSHEDAGDTDTPRGDFYILMNEEILLHFTGRGTPEEIWAMFEPMTK